MRGAFKLSSHTGLTMIQVRVENVATTRPEVQLWDQIGTVYVSLPCLSRARSLGLLPARLILVSVTVVIAGRPVLYSIILRAPGQ